MAVNKVLATASLTLEVENGKDKTGATIYKKRNFGNVSTTALPEDVYAVATAIKAVLSSETKDYLLVESSKLVNA